MKKKTMAIVLSVVAIGLLNGCQNSGGSASNGGNAGSSVYEGSTVNGENTVNQENDIGKEKAQEIAFKDANVNEADITMLHISKDNENGKVIYEVEFTDSSNQIEYEYEIFAADGSIRQVNREKADTVNNAQNNADVAVSLKNATKKALNKVKGATESDIKIRLEQENGRNVYDGEIIYNQKEYDFEIDADTGEILEWSEKNI